jgi:nicotinamide-nucleotide amidase
MLEKDVVPYLKRRFKSFGIIKSRTIKTTGLAESQVNGRVRDLLGIRPPTTVGIYARLGEVDLRIMAKAPSLREADRNIGRIERIIMRRLKGYIFGCDDDTLELAAGRVLLKKKKTLAIAESCTGGLLSSRITDVPGSSRYFVNGVICYSNGSKENLLGVKRPTLARYGAVSKEVALEMAMGIKHYSCADIGLAITGIAGPTGGTKAKPVGLVYIALVADRKKIIRQLRFKGSRQEIKFQASQAALELLRKHTA